VISLLNGAPLPIFLSGNYSTTEPPPPVVSSDITFVNSVRGGFVNTTSPSIAYPETIENDILLVVLVGDTVSNSSGAVPAGWTKLNQTEHTGTSTLHTFWKRAEATAITSEIWTNILSSGTTGVFTSLCYRNCITTSSPIEASSTGSIAFSTPWSTGTITTLGSNRMVVGIFGGDLSTTTSFAWGAGITERVDYNNNGVGAVTVGDILVPTAETISLSATPTSSASGARFIYSLIPAPSS